MLLVNYDFIKSYVTLLMASTVSSLMSHDCLYAITGAQVAVIPSLIPIPSVANGHAVAAASIKAFKAIQGLNASDCPSIRLLR